MASTTAHPPKHGSWSSVNSHQIMKNYDKSPLASPSQTPPLSRNNSTVSINSLRSDSGRNSGRQQSNASVNPPKSRQGSVSSQTSVQSNASKKSFMGGLFHKGNKEHKEKKAKDSEVLVVTSQHAAAVKTKMMMDPAYREFMEKHKKAPAEEKVIMDPAYREFLEKHKKPHVKTAGITGYTPSAHSSAAAQESRYPHSGPPAVHGGHDLPMLRSIESDDEIDSDEDANEKTRREWNTEHPMVGIPEARSRQASGYSPWVSPIPSRDTSPNRHSQRPALGGKRSSYAGAYHRDANGRWTKKSSPGTMTPIHHHHEGVDADLLAASLAKRLDTSA